MNEEERRPIQDTFTCLKCGGRASLYGSKFISTVLAGKGETIRVCSRCADDAGENEDVRTG